MQRVLHSLKNTLLVLVPLIAFFDAKAQSGTALSFDGVNDRVDLPGTILAASYTKEAWIIAPLDNGAVNNQNILSGNATAFWFPGNQSFRLTAGHNTFPYNQVQDPTPLQANTWYHVAVTYDAATTTMNLYKNGVLVSSNNAVPAHAENANYIGAFIGANYYKGTIDEVRVWNIALTQATLRDWMVRKITSSHPDYANLVAYYTANEGAGVTLNDSKNTNHGTLVGGTAWVSSGAALGDESVHDYVNATKTATITHTASGESFTATSTSGSPDGIHVYRIDGVPSNQNGIVGLGGNNKYFGVFQVNGTAPTYTAEYNYSATAYGVNEISLRLYERPGNDAATWVDASAVNNTTANTLTAAGQTGEVFEYILGSVGNPLPVSFSGFDLVKDRNGVLLKWSTSMESNNTGFMVQRSANGSSAWEDLQFVPSGSNGNGSVKYQYLDRKPINGTNYYRVKQIDVDGNYSFTEIRWMNFISDRLIVVYPIPSNGLLTLEFTDLALINTQARVYNAQGIQVMEFRITGIKNPVRIESLQKGLYMIQFADGSSTQFIRQ